jgi:excisionase family DNA binding protein
MRYSTISEVAAELRVSDESIRRLCAGGVLSAVKVGTAWRIPRVGLRDYLTKSAGGVDESTNDPTISDVKRG